MMELIGKHQTEMNAIRIPAPRLEAVWEESFWGRDMVHNQPAIYLSGWAHFSMHHSKIGRVLVQASVNGSEPQEIATNIRLATSVPNRLQFFVNVVPPIGTPGEPLVANIIFIDTANRRYELAERTFQWSESSEDY